jgi:cation diffusion facilitator family transporter
MANEHPSVPNEPGHAHDDGRDEHDRGFRARLRGLLSPHSHDAAVSVDTALETSRKGNRALFISFVGLALTAVLQGVVVLLSHSVALLGDTLHNFADALTAIPLAIAFTLGRRTATRRFTYGYGRSEDLAGIIIVLFIAGSSALAGYEAIRRLVHPRDLDYLWLVAGASIIGFLGNELVARYRIKVGREIGSAALVADGLHARADGLTSLGVLVGAIGVALGFRLADPIVGLAITGTILVVLRDAGREVFRRLMDAVDPELVDQVRSELRAAPGVLDLGDVRLRWIGHALRAECEVIVDRDLSVIDAHTVTEEAQHRLLHSIPRLSAALVHADPFAHEGDDHHEVTAHHVRPVPVGRDAVPGDAL